MPVGATRATVVIPCFNEEQRLDRHAFRALADSGPVSLLFVNDGSTDGTSAALARLADEDPRISVLNLATNLGKAEAVRLGLIEAIAAEAAIVAYYDADLATPPSEMLRLIAALEDDSNLQAVFGSRVARLGSHVHRSHLRHYTGRVFATIASSALGVSVYDTQCGAKAFRRSPALAEAVAEPFPSSWAFDVRLIHRLLVGNRNVGGLPPEMFLEVPLVSWTDVKGSNVDIRGAVVAVSDVVRVGIAQRRLKRRSGAANGTGIVDRGIDWHGIRHSRES